MLDISVSCTEKKNFYRGSQALYCLFVQIFFGFVTYCNSALSGYATQETLVEYSSGVATKGRHGPVCQIDRAGLFYFVMIGLKTDFDF